MKKIFIFSALGLILSGPFLALAALPQTETQEIDHDPFGIWQSKPQDFQQVTEAGARVVYMPEEKTFTGTSSKRLTLSKTNSAMSFHPWLI